MEKIKLDIHGSASVTAADWEDGFDAVSAVSDMIDNDAIEDGSVVSGSLTVPVAPPSKVSKINARWNVVKTDSSIQQFEDKEVCRVLYENASYYRKLITVSEFRNLSNISRTLFSGNKDIKSFDELSKTSITSLSGAWDFTYFNGMLSLETISFDNIEVVQGYVLTECPKLRQVGSIKNVAYFPKLHTMRTTWNTGIFTTNKIKAAFFPAVVEIGAVNNAYNASSQRNNIELVDFGPGANTNYNGDSAIMSIYTVGILPILVIRSKQEIQCNNNVRNTHSRIIFVDPDYLTLHKESQFFSYEGVADKIFPIGGAEWQTEMKALAEKYAQDQVGWTASQISNANYADPYIDYDIFGVPHPE